MCETHLGVVHEFAPLLLPCTIPGTISYSFSVHLLTKSASYFRALSICKSLRDSRILSFSQRYFVHIIEHREGGHERGAGMGGGSTNAQSIAEFNEGLDSVRKAHLQTIKHLRHFWLIPIKKSTDRSHVRKAVIEQMWQHIQVTKPEILDSEP